MERKTGLSFFHDKYQHWT